MNFFDSSAVADAWMRSPAHRANVINPHFTNIGIGVAKGVYQGKDSVFVVEFFGTPPAVSVAPVPAVPGKNPAAVASRNVPSASGSQVLGLVTTQPAGRPSVRSSVEAALTFPNIAGSYALGALFAFVGIALVLAMITGFGAQHAMIVGNGIALMAVIGIFLWFNHASFTGAVALPHDEAASAIMIVK